MHGLANVYQKVNNYSFIVVFGSKQKLPQPTLHFLKNYGNLLHNCFIFISNLPHNGIIYEARMNMMENSGHWLCPCMLYLVNPAPNSGDSAVEIPSPRIRPSTDIPDQDMLVSYLEGDGSSTVTTPGSFCIISTWISSAQYGVNCVAFNHRDLHLMRGLQNRVCTIGAQLL